MERFKFGSRDAVEKVENDLTIQIMTLIWRNQDIELIALLFACLIYVINFHLSIFVPFSKSALRNINVHEFNGC